jgi:PadR family transcriptional regulator, regulatory protein PadR
MSSSMRTPTYFILAALLDEPLHGYGIVKRAEELSSGRVRLTAGTLYAALDRLSSAGLVRTDREEIVNGRARRSYVLTDAGLEAVREEAEWMAEAAKVVTSDRRQQPSPRSAARPAARPVTRTVVMPA